MADLKNIKLLMKHAVRGTVPSEFAEAGQKVDVNAALRDELRSLLPDYNAFRRNKLDVFELLQETYDDVLPINVKPVLGMFADIQFVPNGSRVTFTQKVGKFRAKKFITRVSPSGVYETFRLDKREFELFPQAYGGAFTIDFERFLDGAETIMDGLEILMEGIEDQIYAQIQTALMASWNAIRPADTKKTHGGFDKTKMDALITHVRAFGSPVIICSPQFANEMSEAVVYKTSGTPSVPEADLIDIRERGYIGVYKGVPIVVLPQSFNDDDCTEWTINPRLAYVMPAGDEKVVKIAFEGETIIDEFKNRDRSMEIEGYKKFAVGIVTTKNWGIYQNSSIAPADTNWAILS